MTQYVQPAAAFAAQSDYLAQGASPAATDHRDFRFRCSQKLTFGKGTTQLGTLRGISNARYLAIQDDVWAAVTGAGVDVSDLLTNTSVDPGVGNTSEIITMFNPGTHRQIISCVGDSITNMKIGATSYKKFALQKNQTWSQGMGSCPGGITYAAPIAQPTGSAPQPPEYCFHNRSAHEKSRLKYNFGHDSWRLLNQPGFNYDTPAQTGSGHTANIAQIWKIVVASGQQLLFQIWAVSNDFEYGLRNSNGGLSVATYVQNLTDFITAMKVIHPTAKFSFVVPMCRSSTVNTTTLNASFNTLASSVITNKATIGIDYVLDTRQIALVDCRTPSLATNLTYFQDGVHPTPALISILDPYFEALYDMALGFTPNPTYSGALA